MNKCILLKGAKMAQILKEEVRQTILKSATNLILEYGLNKVSMRQIASAAQMTVGNLYRYYENKEELVKAIYEPFLNDLNQVLALHSNDQIALFKETVGLRIEDLMFVVQNITDALVQLNLVHRDQMGVLMQNTVLGENLLFWFAGVLKSLATNKTDDLYYEMLSISIFNGLGFIFKQNLEQNTLRQIVHRYLSQMITL